LQILALLLSDRRKPTEQSLFDRASELIWCLATEGRVSEWDILKLKGIALINPKRRRKTNKPSNQGYRIEYVKVFDTSKYTKKYEAHTKHFIQINLEATLNRLIAYLNNSYNKTEQGPKLQVRKAELGWQEPAKLKNKMEDLIQIFHFALLVVDYVFDFVKNGEASKLIPHCQKMLQDVKHTTTFWSTIDKLLRIFVDEKAKTETHKETLDNLRQFPSHAAAYLDVCRKAQTPEDYRDVLVGKMDDTFDKRRMFYWNGRVKENDMLLVRFYVLSMIFKKPDVNTLLCLKNPIGEQARLEKERHKQLAPRYGIILTTSPSAPHDPKEIVAAIDSEDRTTGFDFFGLNGSVDVPKKNSDNEGSVNCMDNDSGCTNNDDDDDDDDDDDNDDDDEMEDPSHHGNDTDNDDNNEPYLDDNGNDNAIDDATEDSDVAADDDVDDDVDDNVVDKFGKLQCM
jgi:hypothetical protein